MEQYSRYYTSAVDSPLVMDLGAEALYAEVERIHEVAKAAIVALNPDSEDKNPYRGGWSWGQAIEYMGFHVAYHTGQMYSVRHLLGHETVDN